MFSQRRDWDMIHFIQNGRDASPEEALLIPVKLIPLNPESRPANVALDCGQSTIMGRS